MQFNLYQLSLNTYLLKEAISLFFICGLCFSSYAQVAINTDNAVPDNSAMLDIQSTNKGILIPRMTKSERLSIINPAVGLMVYDTEAKQFYQFNGQNWVAFGGLPIEPESLLNQIPLPDFSCMNINADYFFNENVIDVTILQDHAYILTESGGGGFLRIFNIDNSNSLVLVNSLQIGLIPRAIAASNNLIVIVENLGPGNGQLRIIDVTNPATPTSIGTLGNFSQPVAVAKFSSVVFVVDEVNDHLKIIDINDPANPSVFYTFDLDNNPSAVAVSDGLSGFYAYTLDQGTNGFKIIDFSNPFNPSLVGSLPIGSVPRSVVASDNFVYVAENTSPGSGGVRIIDVNNPVNPVELFNLNIFSFPKDIAISGDYLHVIDRDNAELASVWVKFPTSPSVRSTISIGTDPTAVAVEGNVAYVTGSDDDDLKSIQLSCGPMPLKVDALSGAIVQHPLNWEENGGNLYNVNSDRVGIGTKDPIFPFQVGEDGDGTNAVGNGWLIFSDSRLKQKLEIIDSPLEKLNALQGYYYHWKSEKADTSRQLGVLAQEVETVLPEIVETATDGTKTVDYSKLSAFLIEVNKAQQDQISALENQLKQLHSLVLENHKLKTSQLELEKRISHIENVLQSSTRAYQQIPKKE